MNDFKKVLHFLALKNKQYQYNMKKELPNFLKVFMWIILDTLKNICSLHLQMCLELCNTSLVPDKNAGTILKKPKTNHEEKIVNILHPVPAFFVFVYIYIAILNKINYLKIQFPHFYTFI